MKTIFLLMIFFTLNAESIQIAELRKVYSNDMQKFSIGMTSFICQPYGIVPLEEVLANQALTPTCKQEIEKYYLENPTKKYFIEMALYLRQNYHITFNQRRCIVYAFGQKTLSEALLEQGLAIIQTNFNDDEFRYLYTKAQERAKRRNAGIWSDEKLQACITGIYK